MSFLFDELLPLWELPLLELVEFSVLSPPPEVVLVCGCSVASSLDVESDLTLFNSFSIFSFAFSPVSVPKISTDFNSLPLIS